MSHAVRTRRRRRHRAAAWLALAALGGTTACYSLAPLAPADVAGGREVSAALTERARVDYQWRLGPGIARVDGTVEWARADSIRLLMRRTEERDGTSVAWGGEPVTFARGELHDFAVRRLDRRRSWWAAAGVGVLAVLATAAASGGSSGGEALPPGGTNPH